MIYDRYLDACSQLEEEGWEEQMPPMQHFWKHPDGRTAIMVRDIYNTGKDDSAVEFIISGPDKEQLVDIDSP